MSSALDDDLALARTLGAEAGEILRQGSGHAHGSDTKSGKNDLVTEFDRRSEAQILKTLRAARPDDHIVAEESGLLTGSTARRWLIDPLDGTTNFAHGLPFFCVSIGLEEAGELRVGVVEVPALDWSFYVAKGRGAFLRERGAERRLEVSATPALDRALLATGFPADRATNPRNNFDQFIAFQKRAHGVRRVGAAALDLAMVAAGWLDGYWEMRLKPWDLAAGALLVTEAGGHLSNWSRRPFSPDEGEVVASNGRIHEAMLQVLSAR